jgi:hypothetical protein
MKIAGAILQSVRSSTLAALALLALGGAACSPPSSGDAGARPPSEPNLTEQVQAVRDGRSDQIRLDQALVTDDDLRQLAGLEDQLLRINCSHTEITDRGLALISRLPRLEQVRLAIPRISDAGLACLAELKQLRFLHLIDAPVTDAGLDHLHGLSNLESLYLDGTGVTDAGIERLVAALPGVHLHIDDHHHRLDPHADDHQHPAADR